MKKAGLWTKRILLILCFFVAAAVILHAQSSQRIIPLSSPIYRYMDYIYLEQGMTHPNKARPWSVEEARFILEKIDHTSMSPAGIRTYEFIQDDLRGDTDEPKLLDLGESLRFRVGGILNPELFTRVNLDKDGETTEKEYIRQHGYEERKAFIEMPLELTLGDNVYMLTELSGKEEHGTVNIREEAPGEYPEGVTNNYTNLIFDDPNARIDLYFPFRAFASTGGRHWNLQFGRDSLSWGNAHSGNMMLSDYSDFYDFIGLSFYGKRIKLTNIFAVMDPVSPKGGESANISTDLFAFFGRRLDIRITERILLSLSEAVTLIDLGGRMIRDLNYLMIFHNRMIPERSNSLFTAELSVNPWRNMNIYGQFAMDEFQTQYEGERTGGGGPPILGYLAGAEGVYPIGEGYLTVCMEGAITSPWLYHRRKPPYFYNVREYWSLTTDKYEYIVKPIGYRYGPDSLVLFTRGSYEVPGGISTSASITYLLQGENRYLPYLDPEFEEKWNWDGDGPETGVTAPTGTAQRQLLLNLTAEYPFKPWFTAGGAVYYSAINNFANEKGRYSHDLEFTAFATLTLP